MLCSNNEKKDEQTEKKINYFWIHKKGGHGANCCHQDWRVR